MISVLLFVLRHHHDVVDINENEVQSPENVIDVSLECLSCILESEWHSNVLVQSPRCCYGCLLYALWTDWNLVIGFFQIEDGKNLFSMYGEEEALDEWW